MRRERHGQREVDVNVAVNPGQIACLSSEGIGVQQHEAYTAQRGVLQQGAQVQWIGRTEVDIGIPEPGVELHGQFLGRRRFQRNPQEIFEQLAGEVDCPLHLGITEAGGLIGGTVKSAIGIGNLLWAGIGDTIRVSLSAEPEEEVRVGYEILKALGIRSRGVRVVSCPSCARQGFDVIRTVEALESRLQHIKTPMSLSVLGCVVNGPGEARETDIGITGGGNGTHMVYLSGVTDHHVKDGNMVDHIVKLVEAKAAEIEASDAAAGGSSQSGPAEAQPLVDAAE